MNRILAIAIRTKHKQLFIFSLLIVFNIFSFESLFGASGSPFNLVVPPDPFPWAVAAFFLLFFLIALGVITYFARYLFGEKSGQIQGETKKLLEKSFAEKLAEDYRKKDEALKQKMKDLRGRFTMVFMKVRNLVSSLDPEKIFKAIEDILANDSDVTTFTLFLFDNKSQELYPVRWFGYPDNKRPTTPIKVSNDHFLSYAFLRQAVVARCTAINDLETQGLIDREPYKKTLVAIPIFGQNEKLGVVNIEGFKNAREEVAEEELKFFQALGSYIGMALQNANVFLQTREELSSAKLLTEKELEEKKKLQEIFSKYASPELVATLIKNPKNIKLGGVEKNATILFSDIVGFTEFSSHLSPEQVVVSINEYLSVMTDIVLENKGEIDKFIGDAIMARFGVLVDLPSPGLAAVKTALAMHSELRKLCGKWAQEKRSGFGMRIGIASGPVLAGNIGSERRQEFTVMGTTVNLASRLEALNKELKTSILIDENTFRQISHEIKAVPRENITIRGLQGTMTVYEVIGYHEQVLNKPKIISLRDKLVSQESKEEKIQPLNNFALPDITNFTDEKRK